MINKKNKFDRKEHGRKIGLLNRGKKRKYPSWNKGLTADTDSRVPRPNLGKKASVEAKKKMQEAHRKIRENMPTINCENCFEKMKKRSNTHRFCKQCYILIDNAKRREKHKNPNNIIPHSARGKARYFTILKNRCEICGSNKNLNRHHWNYNEPLLVSTLCSICHKIQHMKFFRNENVGVNIR